MLLKDKADLSSKDSSQIFFHSPAPDQCILHSPLPPNPLWLLNVPLVLAAHLLLTATNENDRLPWEAALLMGCQQKSKRLCTHFQLLPMPPGLRPPLLYLETEYKLPLGFLKQVFPFPVQPNLKIQ